MSSIARSTTFARLVAGTGAAAMLAVAAPVFAAEPAAGEPAQTATQPSETHAAPPTAEKSVTAKKKTTVASDTTAKKHHRHKAKAKKPAPEKSEPATGK